MAIWEQPDRSPGEPAYRRLPTDCLGPGRLAHKWRFATVDDRPHSRCSGEPPARRRLAAEEALRPWAWGGRTPIVGLEGQFQEGEP